MRRGYGQWTVVWGTILWCGSGVRAQTPIFSLWITEVNGIPCSSCPTRNLPEPEVFPGDVVRLEAFVADWDDQRSMGVCSGNPLHGFGQACDLNSPNSCTGSHCFGSLGAACQTGSQCFPFPVCVPSQCIPSPQVAAFQWTLDGNSLTSGAGGNLSLAVVECSPADCADVSLGVCPCAHFYSSPTQCTCAFSQSCSPVGECGPAASAFMESGRGDFLFSGQQAFLTVATGSPNVQFLGTVTGFDAAVAGTEAAHYLGTVLLKVSMDAAGPFTVRMKEDANFTFLNDRQSQKIVPATFLPAVVNVPRCAFVSCDDLDDCTIDTMDPITCACSYAPVPCPTGQRCELGACVEEPLCPRVVESAPVNCGIDARAAFSPPAPFTAAGVDGVALRFDGSCDAARLRLADFQLWPATTGGTGIPAIVALHPDAETVGVAFDAAIPVDEWWCLTYAVGHRSVCFAQIPGDVNGDQRVGPADFEALRGWIERMPMVVPPDASTDLNRSGGTDAEDLTTLMDMLNGVMPHGPRWNAGLPRKCPNR